MLKFLGNGSGFTEYHNNCYFIEDDNLVFIDLSMLNIQKALKVQKNYDNVSILVTHMHDDHVSGIGLFAQYLFYVYHKKLVVMLPKELLDDMRTEFTIKGVNLDIVDIRVIEDGDFFIEKVIPTSHTPELKGKSFGYKLNIRGKKLVYSGDTNCLSDFEPYLNDCFAFYVDTSFSYGGVHLKWEDVKYRLYSIAENCTVYLMHMDDITAFKSLDLYGRNIKLVDIV